MEKEILHLTQNELVNTISEAISLALNRERKHLNEMARVGFCDTYEVYVRTNDPGYIPHFHFRDAATQGEKFETCIQLRTNKYFHHGNYTATLNSKDRKTLANFMESINPSLNMTNYKATCILWNMNNSSDNITEEEMNVIPDYRNIE